MNIQNIEASVKQCYSTWSESYYDDYYASETAYPPVHRDLLKRLLREANVRNVLDAGCGPVSFLRDMTDTDIELFGFDLTSEMVYGRQTHFPNVWLAAQSYLGRQCVGSSGISFTREPACRWV